MSDLADEVFDYDTLTEGQLLTAKKMRISAAEMYEAAIEYAVEQGWSNVKIGKTLGVSEAAIRIYRKRKGIS